MNRPDQLQESPPCVLPAPISLQRSLAFTEISSTFIFFSVRFEAGLLFWRAADPESYSVFCVFLHNAAALIKWTYSKSRADKTGLTASIVSF